jgi:hypothetical protein
MSMKIFLVGTVIISALVISGIALTPPTALHASSKGLKLYLTVDTNLNDNVKINIYQHGDGVFTHDAVIHSGSSEITLQYPSGLIDTGEFRICTRSNNYDESACDTGYNSEAKQPEHLFVNLFTEENRNSPNVDVDNQAQSQNQDNEQSQSQSQNNEQTTTIINCPPGSKCVIEQ